MEGRQAGQQAEKRDIGVAQQGDVQDHHGCDRQREVAHVAIARQGRGDDDQEDVKRIGQPTRQELVQQHRILVGERVVIDRHHQPVGAEAVRNVEQQAKQQPHAGHRQEPAGTQLVQNGLSDCLPLGEQVHCLRAHSFLLSLR